MVLATSVVSSPKPSLFGCGVALGGGGGRSGGSCPAAGGFGACALTGRGPKLRTRAVNNTVLRSDIEVSPRHDAAPLQRRSFSWIPACPNRAEPPIVRSLTMPQANAGHRRPFSHISATNGPDMSALANHAFVKMNGLGNEIVVVDLRGSISKVTAADARAVAGADGAGYDQLMALHAPRVLGTEA